MRQSREPHAPESYDPYGAGLRSPAKAVRTEDTVFIEYTTGEREFYDLKADPYQLDNRISQLSEKEIAALSEAAKKLSECAAVSCRSADSLP